MISLMTEWITLSETLYGEAYVDELSDLLRQHDVKTVLECGCGGGHVLYGLAKQGFSCVGVDDCAEAIESANRRYTHPNLRYLHRNWLDTPDLGTSDSVICRGNSLSCVASWDGRLDHKKAEDAIRGSIKCFSDRLREGGLLYLDTTSESEIQSGGRTIQVDSGSFHLTGRTKNELETRTRRTWGDGEIDGERFSVRSISYLITPDDIIGSLQACGMHTVWNPHLRTEPNYQIICAIK